MSIPPSSTHSQHVHNRLHTFFCAVLCLSALLTWIHHMRIFSIDPHVTSIQICYVSLSYYRCGTGYLTATALSVLPSTLSSRFRHLYTSLFHSYFHQTSSHTRTRYFPGLRTLLPYNRLAHGSSLTYTDIHLYLHIVFIADCQHRETPMTGPISPPQSPHRRQCQMMNYS